MDQMSGRQKMKPFALSDKVWKLSIQGKLSILRSALSLNKKKNKKLLDIVCMRNDFLFSHTNNSLSTDEVSIVDPNSQS